MLSLSESTYLNSHNCETGHVCYDVVLPHRVKVWLRGRIKVNLIFLSFCRNKIPELPGGIFTPCTKY